MLESFMVFEEKKTIATTNVTNAQKSENPSDFHNA